MRTFFATMIMLALCPVAHSAIVTRETSNSGAIHEGGDQGDGQDTEFYASGNDDAFAEYGILGFTYTAADFGLATISAADINSVSLSLTVNDRNFSDGDAIEFFFSGDTFASLGDGSAYTSLSYDTSLTNGLDTSQFSSAPISLGTYSMAEFSGRTGGEVDPFELNFSGAALDGLLSSINAGSDFQILGTATAASHDITYSGFGNTFDPGNPSLAISAVPEPGSLAGLGLLGLALLRRRRR